MATPDLPPEGTLVRLLEWVASAIGGALVALVAFRTKLALQDGAIQQLKTDAIEAERRFADKLDELRRDTEARHNENARELRLLRRQQLITLKMIADIARQTGADKRFDDAIVQFLAAAND